MSQTVDSIRNNSKLKGFFTIKAGVNMLHPVKVDNESTVNPDGRERKVESYSTGVTLSFSVGMFFSKCSFVEIGATYWSTNYTNYDDGGFYKRKVILNKSLFGTANYGYKIPLGKRQKGHFAIRGGMVFGSTSIDDGLSFFWGQHSTSGSTSYKKGIALGYNAAVTMGFTLNKRTRLNIDWIYTHAVYFPTYMHDHSDYYYKAFSGPKIPINQLSLNVGLSWGF